MNKNFLLLFNYETYVKCNKVDIILIYINIRFPKAFHIYIHFNNMPSSSSSRQGEDKYISY